MPLLQLLSTGQRLLQRVLIALQGGFELPAIIKVDIQIIERLIDVLLDSCIGFQRCQLWRRRIRTIDLEWLTCYRLGVAAPQKWRKAQ